MTDIRNQVLDRWATGEGAGLIAKDFNRSPRWVRGQVQAARAAGDPRAISHADAVAGTDKWRARFLLQHRGGKIAGWTFQGAGAL